MFFLRILPFYKELWTKILLVLLFINPGVNLYIKFIELICNEANMNVDSEINHKLESIRRSLGISPPPQVEFEELGDTRGVFSRAIGNIAIFGDSLNKTTNELANSVTNPLETTQKVLDSAKDKILQSMLVISNTLEVVLQLSIKYVINVFFLFFIMPIIYFYILYRIIK